jgi:hypothetical protein
LVAVCYCLGSNKQLPIKIKTICRIKILVIRVLMEYIEIPLLGYLIKYSDGNQQFIQDFIAIQQSDVTQENYPFVVDINNNYKSMKATNDIKSGDLLIIEHVFTGTINTCRLVVRENLYLWNDLHPRVST